MTIVLWLLLSLGFTLGDEGPGICPVGYAHAESGPGADPDGSRVTAQDGGYLDPNGVHANG